MKHNQGFFQGIMNPSNHLINMNKTTKYLSLITGTSLGLTTLSQSALTTGLVGYYDGESNSNSPLASDSDPLTNVGIPTGIAGGIVGGAFQFDNTRADTLTASTSYGAGATDLGQTFTISAWYRVDTDATANDGTSNNGGNRMFVWENASDFDFSFWIDEDGGGAVQGNAAAFVDDATTNFTAIHTFGDWNHVAQTIVTNAGTTTVSTYLDGAFAGSDTGPTATMGNISPLAGLEDSGINFGRARTPASDRPFDGLIDEIGIWNRELSATEISDAYQQGLSGLPLVAIPEPTSLTILGLGSILFAFRRRK